jgi:hypothetical protein
LWCRYIVAVTGIEDKLQEGVPAAIRALRDAGIKAELHTLNPVDPHSLKLPRFKP